MTRDLRSSSQSEQFAELIGNVGSASQNINDGGPLRSMDKCRGVRGSLEGEECCSDEWLFKGEA